MIIKSLKTLYYRTAAISNVSRETFDIIKKHKRRNVSRETFSTNRKNMFHVKHLVDKKMKKCYTGLKSKER